MYLSRRFEKAKHHYLSMCVSQQTAGGWGNSGVDVYQYRRERRGVVIGEIWR
jgi:hypothetical protein